VTPDEKKKILNEIKRAWNALETEDRQAYIDETKAQTTLKGKALLSYAFNKLFVEDYKADRRLAEYRRGGDGCIRWIEDNVYFKIPIPGTSIVKWMPVKDLPDVRDDLGRSPKQMWLQQKEVLRDALRMENGTFVYNLIVFCWMRGESKSWLVVLIICWRFFCFPFQRIFLSASSKELSDFVHFGEAKEMIQNSPALFDIIGEKGITDTEIRLFKGRRGRFNFIKLLSTGSGIVSNASVVTQSEAFEQDNPRFFTKWYGSLRNTHNAMGMIDTTVPASKDHWLGNLKTAYEKNPNGKIFFSHRESDGPDPKDFWNPGMTQQQIDSFRAAFTPGEFSMFFENLWDKDKTSIFLPAEIEAINFFGVDNEFGNHTQMVTLLQEHARLHRQEAFMHGRFSQSTNAGFYNADPRRLVEKDRRLISMNTLIDLGSHAPADPKTTIRTGSKRCTIKQLLNIGNLIQSHFAILVGLDRADPLKYVDRSAARTMVVWIAKGLPGSMNKTRAELNDKNARYVYFLLGVANVEDSQTPSMSKVVDGVQAEFGSIDMMCAETYGMGGMKAYCDDKSIPFQNWMPSKDRQRIGFTELISTITSGRFKAPTIPVAGSKRPDIFIEEISTLDVLERRDGVPKYGSPQKHKKGGVQDDTIFAIIWALYGGLEITASHFRRRTPHSGFAGAMLPPTQPQLAKTLSAMYRTG
jgi:hypothetical protein